MAKVNLLPRKEFEIHLESGEVVSGKFGTWSVQRYCLLKGIPVETIFDKKEDEKTSISDNLDNAALLLLCAVEYSTRLKRKEFNYSLVHAFEWIDELGGISGEQYGSIMAHSGSDEKKNQGSQPASVTSSEFSMQPVAQ